MRIHEDKESTAEDWRRKGDTEMPIESIEEAWRAHRYKVNGVLGDFSGTELVKWSLAANQGAGWLKTSFRTNSTTT